jgi:hypothetical protein
MHPLGVNADDEVEMVRHDGISSYVHREHPGQLFQALHDPPASMLETPPEIGILPTQIRPPHTARNDVVPGGIAQTDQTGTRLRHLPASFSVRLHANTDAERL